MITVIYTEPQPFSEGVWLIGYSQSQFEKVKANIFHRGSREDAQKKIDGMPVKRRYRYRGRKPTTTARESNQ